MGATHERLKVHRRTIKLDHKTTTVLALRPDASMRYSTSQEGGAWQIHVDATSAQLLGRLCWAMAFQRHPHTVTVIDQTWATRHEGESVPSLPLLITNVDNGPFTSAAALELASALPLQTPSEGTVVLQTRGLDLALEDPVAFAARDEQSGVSGPDLGCDEVGGLLAVQTSAAALRSLGVALSSTRNLSEGFVRVDNLAEGAQRPER